MKLKTTLFGQNYAFRDVKDVLAKANEEKSGDMLAGIAARGNVERVAAKAVLADDGQRLPVLDGQIDMLQSVFVIKTLAYVNEFNHKLPPINTGRMSARH